MTQRVEEQGNPDRPTVVLVHGRAESPQVWDPVVGLLGDGFRIAGRDQRGADGFAAVLGTISDGGPVHVLTTGAGAAAVWRVLGDPAAAARIASVTVCGAGRRRALPHAAPGTGDPGRRTGAADRRRPMTPRPTTTCSAPRMWRRIVAAGPASPETHAGVVARSLRQLVDHLDGAPAHRELLRAQVGRVRKAFGDTAGLDHRCGQRNRPARRRWRSPARAPTSSSAMSTPPASTRRPAWSPREGAAAHSYTVDVADAAAVEAFAEQVCVQHGVPDIVVNNAGVGHAGFFLDTPADEFDRVLDINFGGVVNGCRSFGRRLVERGTGGHIVNIASMASYTPVSVMNAYCTSKAAVFMFSDCLRAELDSAGVGITTICPGVIGTNIVDTTRFSLPQGRSREAETLRARAKRGFSVRRYGPEKVAAAIVNAVKKNKAVRPVTPEAYAVYGIAHAAPQAMRSAARGGNIV